MTLAAIVAYKGGGSMVRLTCLDFGLTLGLAAIYSSSLGHAHMVILTFFGHFICSISPLSIVSFSASIYSLLLWLCARC